jgi:hypothetical protein
MSSKIYVGMLSTVVLCLLLALLATPLRAQVTTGTILGTVRDNSQAVVSGAQVTITEAGKGTSQKFNTDDTGAYSAPFLIPGTYTVTVEMAGFKKQIRTGVVLQVDQKARLDFVLEVGEITETIDVVGGSFRHQLLVTQP